MTRMPRTLLVPIALFFALAASLATPRLAPAAGPFTYPATRASDVADDYFGTKVADPYRWLEDADAQETADWVTAQNEVTFKYLESIPEREWIKNRLTQIWDYPRYGIPSHEGDWYIFSKNDGLQNQAVVYKQRALDGEASVLIDPNSLSSDGTVALSVLDFSFDGRYAAYGTSTAGSDWVDFHVREVATGNDLPDHLERIKFSGAAWTHDHKGFFYSRYPAPEGNDLTATNRNHTLYYHALGTTQDKDPVVYARPDKPEWGIYSSVTEDGRYAILYLSEGTDRRDRVYYIELGAPAQPKIKAPVIKLLDEFDANYSFVGNDGPVFYFTTDVEAPRARLIAIDTRHPERTAWKTIIPEGADVLTGVSYVSDKFLASYLHDAYTQVRVFATDGTPVRNVDFPTLGTAGGFHGKRSETETFYVFTSFLYPSTVYRYDLASGTSTVFRAPEVDFDPSAYETKQVFFPSKDGTKIPMFLTYRRGMTQDGTNPTALYGYGGFKISVTPSFSPVNLVWLEMGGIYASVNLRGGGEYGEEWHKAGMLGTKQNVFDDCIAAAEYLTREKYTSPEKLVLKGHSNGGLLVGAVMTQRPDLCAVALPGAGVLDMLRFHKFTIGWAWKSDYGSSEDAEGFKTLYAYSPVHNVTPGTKYPATLVTAADHDDRVVPGHSFKFTSTLQAAQAGDAPVMIRIDTKAGHGAGKPTTKLIEEYADEWAFAAANVGLKVDIEAGAATSRAGRK